MDVGPVAGPRRARALGFFERIEGRSGAGMGLPECRRIMELHPVPFGRMYP